MQILFHIHMYNNGVEISEKLGQASQACFCFVHFDSKYLFLLCFVTIWKFAESSRKIVLFVIFVSIARNMIDTRQQR